MGAAERIIEVAADIPRQTSGSWFAPDQPTPSSAPKWLALTLSLGVGCGGASGGLNQTSITCPQGRTLLDGVCVNEAVVNHVARASEPRPEGGLVWEDMKGPFDPKGAVYVGPAGGGVYVCRADFSSAKDGWHAGKTYPANWPRCSGEWDNATFNKPGQILRAHDVELDWQPIAGFPSTAVSAGTSGRGEGVFVCRGLPNNGSDGWHAGKAWVGNGAGCSMEWDGRTNNPTGQVLVTR